MHKGDEYIAQESKVSFPTFDRDEAPLLGEHAARTPDPASDHRACAYFPTLKIFSWSLQEDGG